MFIIHIDIFLLACGEINILLLILLTNAKMRQNCTLVICLGSAEISLG